MLTTFDSIFDEFGEIAVDIWKVKSIYRTYYCKEGQEYEEVVTVIEMDGDGPEKEDHFHVKNSVKEVLEKINKLRKVNPSPEEQIRKISRAELMVV